MLFAIVSENKRIEGFARLEDVLVWHEGWGKHINGEEVPAGFDVSTNDPDGVAKVYDGIIKPTQRQWLDTGAKWLCSASINYKSREGSGCISGDGFYQLFDGRIVIGHEPHHWFFESLDNYCSEMVSHANREDVRFGVHDDVPDDIRLVLAPLVGRLPTQKEANAATDAMWERIHAELEAERIIREGGQALDETPINSQPDEPTLDQCSCTIEHEGKLKHRVRLKAVGFTTCDDNGDPIDDIIEQQGGRIHYRAPAIAGDAFFAGTISGGEIREICYTLSGDKRWMYVALHDGGDTWCQECWTTDHRLNAAAAADTIIAAKKLAH